jgi:hypothetical protein
VNTIPKGHQVAEHLLRTAEHHAHIRRRAHEHAQQHYAENPPVKIDTESQVEAPPP